MMKKKVWLVLLAVVLVSGLVMFGCGGGKDGPDGPGEGEEEDLVEKVVFDLETDAGIQALTVGAIENTEFVAPNNPLAPLNRAGENSHIAIEIVDNAGKKAIKYTVVDGDWGVGIDLPYASFGFREGDKVKVAGKVITGAENKSVLLNVNVGAAQTALTGTEEYKDGVGDFLFEGTVSAGDLSKIKAGKPAGIRLEARAVGFEIQVNTVKIEGMRPSNLVTLAAPVISLAESTISWAAIANSSGYAIYKGNDAEPFASTASTSYNLRPNLEVGTYSITVVAKGLAGSSKDSPKSNAVSYTKEAPVVGGEAEVVWEPTITADTALNGSGEYVGSTGIKRDSNADEIVLGVVDGGFTVTVKKGTYKQFCVQVGDDAGGSQHYTTSADAFFAEVGTDYTITFMASVSAGTGQIRLGANNNADDWDGSFNLTTTPTEVTYSWTQDSGNLKLDTGSTAIDNAITITDIKITTP